MKPQLLLTLLLLTGCRTMSNIRETPINEADATRNLTMSRQDATRKVKEAFQKTGELELKEEFSPDANTTILISEWDGGLWSSGGYVRAVLTDVNNATALRLLTLKRKPQQAGGVSDWSPKLLPLIQGN